MTIQINYTSKSGAMNETITNVRSYRDTSVWSIEVIFNDGKKESLYAVESAKELSEPEGVIYELSYHFMDEDTGRMDRISIAYSKSIDKLKQKAIDTNSKIYDQQWINIHDSLQLDIGEESYKESYTIVPINLI